MTKVIGLDISDKMVEEYNNKAERTGYSDKMSAQTGDILAESASTELSGPEFFNFDVLLVSMALHHFDDPGRTLKCLGERLKKGGVCVIVDIVPEADGSHQHFGHDETADTVKTHGFTLEQMKGLFADAGMAVEFGYQVVQEPLIFNKNRKLIPKTIFVAKAQRS